MFDSCNGRDRTRKHRTSCAADFHIGALHVEFNVDDLAKGQIQWNSLETMRTIPLQKLRRIIKIKALWIFMWLFWGAMHLNRKALSPPLWRLQALFQKQTSYRNSEKSFISHSFNLHLTWSKQKQTPTCWCAVHSQRNTQCSQAGNSAGSCTVIVTEDGIANPSAAPQPGMAANLKKFTALLGSSS